MPAKKKSTKKKSTRRRAPAKKKSTRKRPRTTQAAMISGKPMNVAAMVIGGLLAWNYKDAPQLEKIVKDPKMRYAAMAAVGLFGPKMLGPKLKIPEAVQFALLGAGIGAGIAAVKENFPKMLPGPKASSTTNKTLPAGGRNGQATLTTKAKGTGRLSQAETAAVLHQFIQDRKGMNGRRGTMMGRRGTIMGRERGVIMGLPPTRSRSLYTRSYA